nr:rhomboid family intramembrane serine protease [Natronospira proteinivora]
MPLHKKPNRENFPYVTAVLLLLNLLVFFGLQGSDGKIEEDGARYYLESSLAETEWEWFEQAVEPADRAHWQQYQEVEDLRAQGAPDLFLASYQAHVIEGHPRFLDQAEAGAFAERSSEDWQAWADKRREYEAILDESFSRQYLLSQQDTRPLTFLTHMFMHGSFMHLFGNMLFLVLLGLLVEGALGRGLFLGSYLVSGLAAAGLSLAVNWGSAGGMLGASGAIAGLMGLYAVLYGRRRVRFFYWFFVYFDYVRAPAIVLLPAWLGWEVFQFLLDSGSNVAYEAHIGGLVAGALMGLAIRRLGLAREAFLEEDSRREEDQAALREAREAVADLKPDRAKLKLRPLLERHPHDPDVNRCWYAACKLKTDDPERHQAAEQIFLIPGETPPIRALIVETLKDYRQQGRIRLRPATLLELAARLTRWGELEEASRLLRALLRTRKAVPGLADACLMLGRRLLQQSGMGAAKPYLEQAEARAERPGQRQAARTLLNQ